MSIFTDIYNTVAKFFRQSEEPVIGEASKAVAANRLRLVLMQDRTNLTPRVLEQMRSELVDFSYGYMLNQQCIVVKADNLDAYKSEADLAGKKVCVEGGSAGESDHQCGEQNGDELFHGRIPPIIDMSRKSMFRSDALQLRFEGDGARELGDILYFASAEPAAEEE